MLGNAGYHRSVQFYALFFIVTFVYSTVRFYTKMTKLSENYDMLLTIIILSNNTNVFIIKK